MRSLSFSSYAPLIGFALLASCSNGASQIAPAGPVSQGAASVALKAIQPESIVYTPTNEQITNGGKLKLDINNNGTANFEFVQYYHPNYCQHGIGPPQVCGALGGLVVLPHKSGDGTANGAQSGWAAVLPYGSPIDSEVSFYPSESLMYDYGAGNIGREHPFSNGYWNGVRNEYLGLKITLHGQIHYGWVQMSSGGGVYNAITTLTGYAYETVAGKSITAGQIK